MRFAFRLLLVGLALLLAGTLAADDSVTPVLGTGSLTGAVTASEPDASAVGNWLQVTGGKRDETFLTFQVTAMGANVVRIEASLDGVNGDTLYTFTADKQIYRVEACGGCLFRAVCGTFAVTSPVVTASVSGAAKVTPLVP
jgi:hypothetical protein